MTLDFVKKLAEAIAKANGHTHPETWAKSVLEHFDVEEETPKDSPAT
jgi:hypothetical protein